MNLELSSEQSQAVDADAPAIVVSAGAGSGKTEVVARRVERLLDESPDESFRILALSYTVKAADELRDRVASRVGGPARVDTETIHAFAHNLIRQHGTWDGLPLDPEVLTRDEDRVEVLLNWLEGLGTFLDPAEARDVLADIDLSRAKLETARYLSEYNDALASRGALDYPAMLDRAARLLTNDWVRAQVGQTYRHVIIDEAQNLTPAQYHLLTCMLGSHPPAVNVMLVGDEKQSIVQFAGADPGLMKRFERDYDAQRIALTKNFRSAFAIASIADAVAAELRDQAPLSVVAAAPGRVNIRTEATEDAEGIATASWVQELLTNGLPSDALAPGESEIIQPEDVAVLARTGAALRWTAAALDESAIEYTLGSDPRNWMSSRLGQAVADLIAFRAGPHHPSAQAHLSESAGAPIDDLGSSTVVGFRQLHETGDDDGPERLFKAVETVEPADEERPQWADDHEVLMATWHSFIDRTAVNDRSYGNLQLHVARAQRGEPGAKGVRLMTVHKSQGREFKAVAVVGLNDGQFPDFRQTSEVQRRAELHCFYVAVTRASRVLHLSRAEQRMGRNGPFNATESEYLRIVRSARALRG